MARYLRSQDTGVVLPYNAKLERLPNVETLTPAECEAYEQSVRKPAATPAPVVVAAAPEPEPVVVEAAPEPTPEPKAEEAPVAITDLSEGEPNVEDVLAGLELD